MQLRMMELGGNQRFMDFMEEQGVPQDLPIRAKYSTRAAAWYRENLRALAEGLEPPLPLPPGVGHLPMHSAPDPMLAVLDRVFASVQCDLKQDPILAAVELHSRAEALHRKQKVTSSNLPEWVCEQFQQLVDQLLQITEGDRSAVRLKEMSTGRMDGFGGDRCTLPSSAIEASSLEASEGDPTMRNCR